MTIEEIKEWRKSGPAEPDYGELEIIDTLLDLYADNRALINALKSSIETHDAKLTIAIEALEEIITNCGTGSEGAFIARTALERIKG